jgi:ATP-binding cassette subfamily C protein LapB
MALMTARQLKNQLSNREEYDNHRFDFIIETLKGIHTIKAMGMEAAFLRRYEKLQTVTDISNYYIAKASNVAASLGAVFTQIMIVGIVTLGSLMVVDSTITVGTLIACVLLSGRIMQPIQNAMGIWTRYQDFQIAWKRVNTLHDMPLVERKSSLSGGAAEGKLVCQSVGFSYDKNQRPVLHNVNLDLSIGTSIAITSAYGSGKSTLLKLISGLYVPSRGSVLLDGSPPHLYSPEERLKHVGYLPMQGAIFEGTIRDNLSGFREKEHHNVVETAKLLGIDSAISKLPKGYETVLEDTHADSVPPGLKQRIAMGRILANNPPVLLFDNADSTLDRKGLQHVIAMLKEMKPHKAMIIISENRDIVALADQRFILEDGRLLRQHKGELV